MVQMMLAVECALLAPRSCSSADVRLVSTRRRIYAPGPS